MRAFLLSPASCRGERAQMLLSDRAIFPLARRLRSEEGAELGEVFAFLSGLYFRGKLAYAQAFAAPVRPGRRPPVYVITPNAGLLEPHVRIDLAGLQTLRAGDIDARNPRYREPLLRDARRLSRRLGRGGSAVLLGSIASDKYVDVLLQVFGKRLLFPPTFVGRGDMSRGGLLLRCTRAREELEYGPVEGAVRHGARPPRLPPLRGPRPLVEEHPGEEG